MAEKRSSHLRVVRTTDTSARSSEAARAQIDSSETYFAQLQALRDERRRLRAG